MYTAMPKWVVTTSYLGYEHGQLGLLSCIHLSDIGWSLNMLTTASLYIAACV